MPRTLLDNVWDAHTDRTLPSGQPSSLSDSTSFTR